MSKKNKEERLIASFKNVILSLVQGKHYTAMTRQEMMQKLRILPEQTPQFQEALDLLTQEKSLSLKNLRYDECSNIDNLATGILRIARAGFGFVEPDDVAKWPQDIFIPKHQTMGGIEGDRVEVEVNIDSKHPKGPEGKVVTILERSRSQIAGIVVQANTHGAELFCPLLGKDKKVFLKSTSERTLRAGDRVLVKVLDWGDEEKPAQSSLLEYIGHISDPSCDVKAASLEFGIRSTFPEAVLEEAKALGGKVTQRDMEGRIDLTEEECFTIDPDTAKDYDDAVSLFKDDRGHYHLGVHIADVSHYVKLGSELDKEAKLRCNSTYFPGICLPMLPHELSNELCSLKAKVKRLTITVSMEFNPDGDLVEYDIARSVIKSAQRFTYKEAKAILDGKKRSIHAPTMRLMVEMCHLLKKKRFERGSIEFGMPEVVILVDEMGNPTGFETVEYDITHQLIEEFMLKANEVVATHLDKQGKSLPFRVHEEPSPDAMEEFSQIAASFGYKIPSKPTAQDLQKLFEDVKNQPFDKQLATRFIRSMRLAIYSANNLGHYGLSLTHYTHFTSPIRRYVDLIIHRLVMGEIISPDAVAAAADHCSERERNSAKSEISVTTLKKLRLLKAWQTENKDRIYEAIVSRVKPFGILFEIPDIGLDGSLHISELGDDYYVFDENKQIIFGKRSKAVLRAGDIFTVKAKAIDLITQEVAWTMAPTN